MSLVLWGIAGYCCGHVFWNWLFEKWRNGDFDEWMR